jgi:hypothetical protein
MDTFAGISNAPAPFLVLAGSGSPARAFTAADVVAGAWDSFTLLANGLSNAPSFPSGWTQQGSGSYSNVAGTQNFITVGNDWWNDYYCMGADSNGVTYPVPVSFIGSNGTQTLTIDFAGAALSTAALPSGAWFSIAGSRPGASAGLSSPLPYQIAASVGSLTSTSVVLKITGGAFLDGDIVTLSYTPSPPGNPLQDAASGVYKVPGWTGAIVTVQ